jgi:hypothetical protein
VTLITGFACHWVFMRAVRSLLVMLAGVVALLFYQAIEFQIDRNQEQWCVHSVRGHDCISWIRGNDLVFASDSILAKDRSAINFHFQRYWDKQGVDQRQSLFLSDTTLLSEKSAQVGDVTKLGNMTFGFPGRSEFILCNEIEADVYILSASFQEQILQIDDWSFLSGKIVFVTDGWYGYKRKKLLDRMPEDAIITDLSEGAWIYSENKWNHFLEDTRPAIPR